jgi:putative DNA-invertase from lambdoid prophage Rac
MTKIEPQTILYARVSTTDQNIEHQKTQAEEAGFVFDDVYADKGSSGLSTTLREREEGKKLYERLRRGDVLVVRWVDRLGRNYTDVTDAIRYFMGKGVVIKTVINKMVFDGSTENPMEKAVRDALIAFMAATAEAQAEATKEAQKAGIAAVKGDPVRYRGKKPSYDRSKFVAVQELLSQGKGTSVISKEVGVSRQAVLRIKENPSGASEALARWGM